MRRFAMLAVLASSVLVASFSQPSHALAGWNAGRIINDDVFTASTSMSASQIQTFLNNRVPSCDSKGEQLSEYGGSDLNKDGKVQRWEWAKAKYGQSTFTCLKNYSVNGKKASQIIYDIAQKYRISPKVLLVLLQKEQSLVNDTWPLNVQYRTATGYGCPDTAPCDAQYYGLVNQLDWAGKMFRAIMDNSPNWYTPYEVGTNYIQYSPTASCGGSNVYIENRATQALYNYTPYQPNKAALNAGWGTAACGAYGNRNFYLYFTSWFGRPNGDPYKALDEVRWMQLNKAATKYDLVTGSALGDSITSATQLFFVDKININGEYYLRTEYDSEHNYQKGIKLSDIEEIPYTALAQPVWKTNTSETYKYYPHSGIRIDSEKIEKNSSVLYSSQTIVNGTTYYRTAHDTDIDVRRGVPASSLTDLQYSEFSNPRYLRASENVEKINPLTGAKNGVTVNAGMDVRFESKIFVGDQWYYRSTYDTANNTVYAVPSSALQEIAYASLSAPKLMLVTAAATKVSPTNESAYDAVPAGARIQVNQKITVNNRTFYRSSYDAAHKLDKAIDETALAETTDPHYTNIAPKTVSALNQSASKLDTYSFRPVESLPLGKNFVVNQIITINGQLYYRTSYDSSRSIHRILSAQDVQ